MELLKKEKIKYIIVHHSERDVDSPEFIKERHIKNRNFKDIGYHFLIGNGEMGTTKGKLYLGRDTKFWGAHAYGYNDKSIGICLVGNFDKKKPSEKQIKKLINFLKEKMSEYNIPKENVLGHRELPNSEKTCPGKNIDMNEVRNLLY